MKSSLHLSCSKQGGSRKHNAGCGAALGRISDGSAGLHLRLYLDGETAIHRIILLWLKTFDQ